VSLRQHSLKGFIISRGVEKGEASVGTIENVIDDIAGVGT
jgi:hypothetical protein